MTNEITADEKELMDEFLLESQYFTECKQLPLDILEEDELVVVEKCLNQEELTPDELTDRKSVV